MAIGGCAHRVHEDCGAQRVLSTPQPRCPNCRGAVGAVEQAGRRASRRASRRPVVDPSPVIPARPQRDPSYSGVDSSPIPPGWVRHYTSEPGMHMAHARPWVQWDPASPPNQLYPRVSHSWDAREVVPLGYYYTRGVHGVPIFERGPQPEVYRIQWSRLSSSDHSQVPFFTS